MGCQRRSHHRVCCELTRTVPAGERAESIVQHRSICLLADVYRDEHPAVVESLSIPSNVVSLNVGQIRVTA